MENQKKTTETPEQISKLIGNIVPEEAKPPLPRKPVQYDLIKASNPNHHLVLRYHEEQRKYNEYWLKAMPPKQAQEKPPLKQLVQIDFQYLYKLFKDAYQHVNGVKFDPDYNDGEPKFFVYTLMYYMFKDERFLTSPILNVKINEPNVFKGLLVLGWYGCGKTSVFKTFRHLFFESIRDENLMIKDCEGDMVQMKRYRKLFFAFFSVNDVVIDYESCSNSEAKTRFWEVMAKGRHYYDDLTKEREASNYGKVELFQDILERRYEKKVTTLASLNYSGDTAESTLKAMGAKYGPRVYDRIFEMFNIVELKGKSLRK